MSTVSVHDLEALVEQFRRSDWREMHLRIGEVELFLSTDSSARAPDHPGQAGGPQPAGQEVPASSAAKAPTDSTPGSVIDQPGPSSDAAAIPKGWVQVRAPSLGTFYGAPKPGAPNFADVGAHVTTESELCLIEVMKLFTTMRSSVNGVVRQIYVRDGDLVEFDQPLFLIESDA